MGLGFALGRGACLSGALALCLAGLAADAARADEGMWPLHQAPLEQWQAQHAFTPGKEWLEMLQRSAVRLSDGGSSSLVSAEGLLLTNHHVARSQIHKLSTATRDLIRDGFYARTRAEELRCPDLEARVLWSQKDVTAQVQGAVAAGASPQAAQAQRKAAIAATSSPSSMASLRSSASEVFRMSSSATTRSAANSARWFGAVMRTSFRETAWPRHGASVS